jgi:hypothetical protein
MLIQFLIGLMALSMPSATPVSCECPVTPDKENLTEVEWDQLVIRQAYERADLVFFAEVTGFGNASEHMDEASTDDGAWRVEEEKRFGTTPQLRLIKTYKGSKKSYRKSDLQISQRWRLCDMYFNRAETYVFFVKVDKDGKLRTSICVPNRLIRFDEQLAEVEAWME